VPQLQVEVPPLEEGVEAQLQVAGEEVLSLEVAVVLQRVEVVQLLEEAGVQRARVEEEEVAQLEGEEAPALEEGEEAWRPQLLVVH